MDVFATMTPKKQRRVMGEADKAKAFDAIAALLDVVPEMVVEAVESREDYVDHIEAQLTELTSRVEEVSASMESMIIALVGDVTDERPQHGQTAVQFKEILVNKMRRRLGDELDDDDG